MLRVAAILIALGLPCRGETPVCKWVEPARMVQHKGWVDWYPAEYWVLEYEWDSDWCFYRYRQHRVPSWVWAEIEIPPKGDEDGEQ